MLQRQPDLPPFIAGATIRSVHGPCIELVGYIAYTAPTHPTTSPDANCHQLLKPC